MGETIEDKSCTVGESEFIPEGYCIAVIGDRTFSGSLDDLRKQAAEPTLVILSPVDRADFKEYTRARRN